MTFKEIISQEKTVVVDFFATWCRPCTAMSMNLEELKKRLGDDITIIKVDIDKNQTTANHFKIQSVPTVMLFYKNEVQWRESGVIPVHVLEMKIKDVEKKHNLN